MRLEHPLAELLAAVRAAHPGAGPVRILAAQRAEQLAHLERDGLGLRLGPVEARVGVLPQEVHVEVDLRALGDRLQPVRLQPRVEPPALAERLAGAGRVSSAW